MGSDLKFKAPSSEFQVCRSCEIQFSGGRGGESVLPAGDEKVRNRECLWEPLTASTGGRGEFYDSLLTAVKVRLTDCCISDLAFPYCLRAEL